MRHLSSITLALGLGVLCTWVAATSLENYRLSQRTDSVQVQQAQYTSVEPSSHSTAL
jgi:hypothetical protein